MRRRNIIIAVIAAAFAIEIVFVTVLKFALRRSNANEE